MIVMFSASLRGKPNAVSIITLDEGDRKIVGTGATAYSHLKQTSITMQTSEENEATGNVCIIE